MVKATKTGKAGDNKLSEGESPGVGGGGGPQTLMGSLKASAIKRHETMLPVVSLFLSWYPN
jgi:hypothetical protein